MTTQDHRCNRANRIDCPVCTPDAHRNCRCGADAMPPGAARVIKEVNLTPAQIDGPYVQMIGRGIRVLPEQTDGQLFDSATTRQLSLYVDGLWSTSLLQHFTGYRAVAKHRVTRKWENRNLRLMRKQGTAAHGGASRDSARTSILSANYMRTQLLQLGGSIRGKNT